MGTIKNSSLALAGFSLVAALGASTALAQSIPPNSSLPNVIERQNRIETLRPGVGGAPVISAPKAEKKSISGTAQFTLKAVKIEGGTVYGEEELKPLYANKIGEKISLDDLGDVAADITSYYRNHGYILTRAVVPPQRAEGGVVTIRIVEGFVNEVKLQGDVGNGRPLLRNYADKIQAAKPLNASTLERYLLLMEDLPGVEARAVLQPAAEQTGASDVIITISRKPITASASFDNRGTRYLGPYQLSATVAANNAFGLEEQTQLRAASSILQTDEFAYGEIRHEEQIGNEGTKLFFSGSYVDTHPGYLLTPLDIHGISYALSIGASHPLIRSRQQNWFVNTDFTWRDVNTDALGSNLYYDKTRAITVGSTFDFVDPLAAINRLEASASQGIAVGDSAGQQRSRANADSSYTKINAKVSRLQPLYDAFSLQVSASGQYAFQPLLASEEFALGGQEFGSAYDTAELTGDSGAAGRAELQYNQSPGLNYLKQYQVYGFYDIGEVYNIRAIAGSEQSVQSLSSAGVGARVNLIDAVSASVEGAWPLTRSVAALGGNGNDPRVFFNVQYRY
ncbi:MAG: ShlB/FhaC/HecB family hemolysin secretion/activation protein [Rickettsiales bacterium]